MKLSHITRSLAWCSSPRCEFRFPFAQRRLVKKPGTRASSDFDRGVSAQGTFFLSAVIGLMLSLAALWDGQLLAPPMSLRPGLSRPSLRKHRGGERAIWNNGSGSPDLSARSTTWPQRSVAGTLPPSTLPPSTLPSSAANPDGSFSHLAFAFSLSPLLSRNR